jgi:hypothetical protein
MSARDAHSARNNSKSFLPPRPDENSDIHSSHAFSLYPANVCCFLELSTGPLSVPPERPSVMSQRRGGSGKEKINVATAEEMVPFGQSLDLPSAGLAMDRESVLEPMMALPSSSPTSGNSPLTTMPAPTSDASAAGPTRGASPPSVSLDVRFEKENHELKLKRWKEGPFATGFTEAYVPLWIIIIAGPSFSP